MNYDFQPVDKLVDQVKGNTKFLNKVLFSRVSWWCYRAFFLSPRSSKFTTHSYKKRTVVKKLLARKILVLVLQFF